MSSTTCYTLGYSSFFPCLVYCLALVNVWGKRFKLPQLTHESFLTLHHSCKIFFWYLPNWTSTDLWCVVLYVAYSTTHQRFVEVQFGRYQKNTLQEWSMVKKLSCVSCGSMKRFPHTFTTPVQYISIPPYLAWTHVLEFLLLLLCSGVLASWYRAILACTVIHSNEEDLKKPFSLSPTVLFLILMANLCMCHRFWVAYDYHASAPI